MSRIRVAIADDQELVRTGFRLVLEADGDFDVVGDAADGRAAVSLVARTRPDVILMDVRMPGLDGLSATRVVARDSDARVIVLTTFDVDEYVEEALRSGASAFLLKDVRPAQLMTTIRDVAAGAGPRPAAAAGGAEPAGQTAAPDDVEAEQLSPREREVFLAIGQGLSNAEIGRELFLSESTVKTHVGRVLRKVGARDRVQAALLAQRSGLFDG